MRHFILLITLLFAVPALLRAEDPLRDGDSFEMRLSGPPEEFTREFNLMLTVDEGSVNVPMIGRIRAAGLSSTQLALTIERRLKDEKIFTIANVNITTSQSQKQRTIIIGGAVRQPGRQQWFSEIRVS